MKVQQCSIDNGVLISHETKKNQNENKSPNFKAGGAGMLGVAGSTMQWIQNQGFLASFLIQDGLGMTAPRVGAAFLRDKEVTGEYNIQEGFEVLGREGLTGPCMMAIAPIAMVIAAKFGKSNSVNSQLIKRFGNSLKRLVSKAGFNKESLKDANNFKKEFYEENLREMLSHTLGKGHVKEENIRYILERIDRYENIPKDANTKGLFGKGKYRNKQIDEIVEYINDLKYNTSSDLDMLGKVKVGLNEESKAFSTRDAIEAMINYGNDAISVNKNLANLDAEAAEKLRDKSLAKRLITNVSTVAATIAVMFTLPKIYARNEIAPGARTAMKMQQNMEKAAQNKEENKEDKENISFKGNKPGKSMLERLGSWLNKNVKDKVSAQIEYNGHNFTDTLMAGLSIFGLLAPRGKRAYERAQIDENGKRDLTELYEILIRDISSTLAVVFAVPMLTRAFVTSYEDRSGFVLMQKDRTKKGWKTALDLINPYSQAHVLKNFEIDALYNNVNNKEKMVNFCKYIDMNNGDLQKILSKSDSSEEVLKEIKLNLDEIKNLSKSEKNKTITEYFEKIGEKTGLGKEKADELIAKLMKGVEGSAKKNKILSFAKGLNSMPAVITTFLISPFLLGWIINIRKYKKNSRKAGSGKS